MKPENQNSLPPSILLRISKSTTFGEPLSGGVHSPALALSRRCTLKVPHGKHGLLAPFVRRWVFRFDFARSKKLWFSSAEQAFAWWLRTIFFSLRNLVSLIRILEPEPIKKFHGSSASASSGSTRGFQEMSQQRLDPDVSLAQNNHNYPHVKLTVRPLKYLKICHRKQERMDRLPNIHVQVRLLFSFREGNYFRNGNFGTAMRPEKKVENER